VTPVPEPAALALMAWIAAKGFCAPSPTKCGLLIDGPGWWIYTRPELVLLRDTPEGVIRVVTDAAGRPVEAVLVQSGPCTLVPGEPRGCPTTVPLGEVRARKELQNAALAARRKLGP